MKKMVYLFVSLLIACSSKSAKDDPVLVEANKIHLEASAIQEEIEPTIENLDSLKALLVTKKTPAADSLVSSIEKIKTDFEEWEKNLFEVPGFEHAHKEGEHHHHDHTPAPELPADKMLEVQKEIKANIIRINQELTDILNKANSKVKA